MKASEQKNDRTTYPKYNQLKVNYKVNNTYLQKNNKNILYYDIPHVSRNS